MGNRKSWQKTSVGQSQLARYTPNTLNQIVSQSLTVNGERTTFGYTHDAGGNLTQRTNSDGSKTLYTYDDADRLTKIETRDPNNAPLHKSEFTYDGFSRKAVSKEFGFTGGAWTLQNETRRVFDGLDCVQERNAQNEVVASYARDGNIGGILSRTAASGQSYFHYDGGGNVTQLTDETGETVARYTYDAFGNTLEASGSRAAENPYRFSSKEFHAASGLYDYGYRFYSPQMGRWLNRDPIKEAGGLNLYGAFANDPVNNLDEYGEQVMIGTLPPWVGPAVGIGARPPINLPRGGTYFLRNAAGRVMRSGRTNNLARRQGEHARDPALSRFRFRVDKRTDNRAAQRGREQIIHDRYNPPMNRIRPIDPKNPNYNRYMEEGSKLGVAGDALSDGQDNSPCPPDNRGWWHRFKDWWSAPPAPSYPGLYA